MPIYGKTRKILWSRSGNRRAICRREPIIDATSTDDESLIGDECHIVSGKPHGPRHNPAFLPEELDDPKNLTLLCRIHHKMVDDQHETYTVEMLQQLKTNHEKWVSLALVVDNQPPGVRLRRIKENIPSYLVRLTSGQDLMKIISNAGAFSFEHDEPRSEEDVESISEFLQEAHDWGDLSSDLEAGDRVKAAYRLSSSIQELEKLGYWVFGGREVQRLEGGIRPALAFPVAILRVVHSASPEVAIIDVGDDTRDTQAQITKDTGSESTGSDF